MVARLGSVVHTFEEVDSTQLVLAQLARDGAPEGTVVRARHQREGRGSHGRRWWDSPEDALLFSLLLRPRVRAAQVPQLSLVAGLAVADALRSAAGASARIRWPNDVLIAGRKVAGILAEATSPDDERVAHVILGIGINVNQVAFPAEIEERATSLRLATGGWHDADVLLSAVLEALDGRYRAWLAGGFAALREEWRRQSSTLGQAIRVPSGDMGVVLDVDEDGALLVDRGDGGVTRVVSGQLDDLPERRGGRAARH